MPELPEVETTRTAIAPLVCGNPIRRLTIIKHQLRWPVPRHLPKTLAGARCQEVTRRGKYLLWRFDHGTLLVHLGMSGSIRVCAGSEPRKLHDHIELEMTGGTLLRYHDPRRFGAWLWAKPDELVDHPLLAKLGPEPLSDTFNAHYLYQVSRNRRTPIKTLIMDAHVVVGVGNIYANEALFLAGIRPLTSAARLTKPKVTRLVETIKQVLAAAVIQGGTTLRDFVSGNDNPGYFAQQLRVYGRGGEPCVQCKSELREVRLAQRTTVYCSVCQR